jgi:NAD(P)-dependent dehydrogenase (short-subunit alcohol dehydrogenase family)
MEIAKIGFVTGGSRGLGRDMALSLARKGSDVIITYFSQKDEADQVVAQITAMGRKALALRLDVGEICKLACKPTGEGSALISSSTMPAWVQLYHLRR